MLRLLAASAVGDMGPLRLEHRSDLSLVSRRLDRLSFGHACLCLPNGWPAYPRDWLRSGLLQSTPTYVPKMRCFLAQGQGYDGPAWQAPPASACRSELGSRI